MDSEKLPTIVLRGSPGEIGASHGAQLRKRIGATWEWYCVLFHAAGATDATLRELGEHFAKVVRAFNAGYADEIEEIAAAAGLDEYKLYCLNARTEVVYSCLAAHGAAATAANTPTECTSLFSPSTGVLAQNWDWDMAMEAQLVVGDIERPDGHRVLCMFEPGIIAKIGMSSSGVGVCLNALAAPARMGKLDGVPIHVLLRACLDAPSFEAACDMLGGARGTCSHILLGSKDGQSALAEFAADTVSLNRGSADSADAAFRLHTNHYLSVGLEEDAVFGFPAAQREQGARSKCSWSRWTRATQMISELDASAAESADAATAAAKRILTDGECNADAAFPICRPWVAKEPDKSGRPDLGKVLGKVGTVTTVVMQLGQGKLLYTKGSPVDTGDVYEELSL